MNIFKIIDSLKRTGESNPEVNMRLCRFGVEILGIESPTNAQVARMIEEKSIQKLFSEFMLDFKITGYDHSNINPDGSNKYGIDYFKKLKNDTDSN